MKTESEPEWIEDIRETLEFCDDIQEIKFTEDGKNSFLLEFQWKEQPFNWRVTKDSTGVYGYDSDGGIYNLDCMEVFRLIGCELLQRNSRLEDENHRMAKKQKDYNEILGELDTYRKHLRLSVRLEEVPEMQALRVGVFLNGRTLRDVTNLRAFLDYTVNREVISRILYWVDKNLK